MWKLNWVTETAYVLFVVSFPIISWQVFLKRMQESVPKPQTEQVHVVAFDLRTFKQYSLRETFSLKYYFPTSILGGAVGRGA